MALIATEKQPKQSGRRLATTINWCVIIASIGVAWYLFVHAYHARYGLPRWLWDLYDWKTWPLSLWREWRNSF